MIFYEFTDMGLTVAEYYGYRVIVTLNLKPKLSIEDNLKGQWSVFSGMAKLFGCSK